MKLTEWAKLDLFTGINIFIDWCEENELDYKNPEIFEQFKAELEKAE